MPPSSPSAEGFLTAVWRRRGLVACLLWPFSLIFAALVASRRVAYRCGVLRSERLPVPVIVVGNITVGGGGKTPLVIALVRLLLAAGRRPGIVSRGHGGQDGGEVSGDADPRRLGDEPVLLARRTGVPVVVGMDRVAAARALLGSHPDCDVIVSDDGLQHYRLRRDVEIAVFDGRGVLNGWRLPAGPLREGVARLREVDAIVCHGAAVSPAPTFDRPVFPATLVAGEFYALHQPSCRCRAQDLMPLRLQAVAGIADPTRFFATLSGLGLRFEARPFPDHHPYVATELDVDADALLTTEKDAVKFSRLDLRLPVWVLPVDLDVPPAFATLILEKLNGCAPA